MVTLYVDALADFSASELDAILSKASRENVTRWAQSPGMLREIGMDLRASGQPEEPRECQLCGGTGYRLYETTNGRVAIACRCVSPETKERIEAELDKPAYYSAKRFAKAERRQATPVKREPIADQKLYRAEDCPEGREFLALLAKVRGKGKV